MYNGLKAQSAIEYLMTYGWMLLVVAVVGGAVFSMVGEQSIESVSGFESGNINVQDFGVSESDGLMFVAQDPVGQTEISRITVQNSESTNITYFLNKDLSGDELVTLPGIRPVGESNQLEVEITYNEGSLQNLTSAGQIQGNLEINQDFHDREILLDGLVGYWPLTQTYSDGSQAYDISGNQNHASHSSEEKGLTWMNTERGDAMNFNGSNQAYIGHYDSLNPRGSFSITLWLGDIGPQPRAWSSIVHKGEWSDMYGYMIRVREHGEDPTFEIGDSDYNSDSVTWNGDISEGPTFLAGIYDEEAEEIRLYVNGEYKNSQFTSLSAEPGTRPLRIARRSDWHTRYFNGTVHNVAIYDRALSEGEIDSLFR